MTTITGTTGNDNLTGTLDDDTIVGGGGGDTLDGGGGNDYIDASSSDSTTACLLTGGSGNDTIIGGAGNDYLGGNSGNDILQGGDGNDHLSRTTGDDNDTMYGGNGDDFFSIDQSFDSGEVSAVGGDGADIFWMFSYAANEASTLTVTGGAGSDTYQFASAYNTVNAVITDFQVGAGGDKIDLSALLDFSGTLGYSGGNPFAVEQGFLRLVQSGADTLLQYDEDGQAGSSHSFHTIATLQNTTASQLTAANFVGDIPPDGSIVFGLTMTGTADGETLQGGYFDDTINGGGGADTIAGGGGNDILTVGGGADQYLYSATVLGGAGNDVITGGDGNDILSGNSGDDVVHGGAGNDVISRYVGDGGDTLYGDSGNDNFVITFDSTINESDALQPVTYIYGGDGDDQISTSLRGDSTGLVVSGGAGSDTYKFSGLAYMGIFTANYDVTDFQVGTGGDRIDLTDLLSWSGSGDRGYGGGNPFAESQGYVRLVQSGNDTLLQYDEDGAANNASGFHTIVTLKDVHASDLTSDNFVDGIAPDGSDSPGLTINGTDSAENIRGGISNDTIIGGGGQDTIDGGPGNDWISEGGGDSQSSVYDAINGGAGNDTIIGGAGPDTIDGQGGDDNINGGDGNDYLVHQDEGGNDTLSGGNGNDTILVMGLVGHDTVIVNGGAGNDQIQSYLRSDQSTFIATGGEGVDTYSFYGDGASSNFFVTDFKTGAGGDQIDVSTLLDWSSRDGRGYSGGNPMSSSEGYLRLVQDGANTLLQYDEDGVGGSAVFHTAITLLNVRASNVTSNNFTSMTIEGTSGDDLLNGGLGVDTLEGGGGNDILDGSWGNDSMAGGQGNDVYYVDNVNDAVVENSDDGSDTVIASTTYTLAQNVENLQLDEKATNGTGNSENNSITGDLLNNQLNGLDGDDHLYGEAGNDKLLGGAGNDVLDGGTGNDSMTGGTGNDVYFVDSAKDVVSEGSQNGGIDTISTTLSTYTLVANVENLTYIGSNSFAGIGNGLNNIIQGSGGNDILNGGAGNDTLIGNGGNDTLIGGKGLDQFVLNSTIGNDVIVDFQSRADKIVLDSSVFTQLDTSGSILADAQFWSSSTAVSGRDDSDRIIYNSHTGALYYDADGSGAQAAVQIAIIGSGTHPALTAADFMLI